jgi:hypothetical protein
VKQLDKLRREGIHGGPNFLTWFREHVNNPHLTSSLSVTCIVFNHLTYLIGSQCVLVGNVHVDLRQLSYGSVVAKSYYRYNVNGFRFHSTVFKLIVHWQQQLIQELLRGLLMQKDTNLSTTGSLKT